MKLARRVFRAKRHMTNDEQSQFAKALYAASCKFAEELGVDSSDIEVTCPQDRPGMWILMQRRPDNPLLEHVQDYSEEV